MKIDVILWAYLSKTAADKCPVSRITSGVDTIKIEDSVNTRTARHYKVQ